MIYSWFFLFVLLVVNFLNHIVNQTTRDEKLLSTFSQTFWPINSPLSLPWHKVFLNHNDVIKNLTFHICRNYKGVRCSSSAFSLSLSLFVYLTAFTSFLTINVKQLMFLPCAEFGLMGVKIQMTTITCWGLLLWMLTRYWLLVGLLSCEMLALGACFSIILWAAFTPVNL